MHELRLCSVFISQAWQTIADKLNEHYGNNRLCQAYKDKFQFIKMQVNQGISSIFTEQMKKILEDEVVPGVQPGIYFLNVYRTSQKFLHSGYCIWLSLSLLITF